MSRGRPAGRQGAVLAAALVVSLAAAGAARAQVAGSRHDFSSRPIADGGGVCSPCHRVHEAPATPGIYKRDLTDEAAYYNQSANPNYRPRTTLLCYDCHDDMLTVTDRDPPPATWSVGYEPQDVALANTASDQARWDSPVGYYELYDGGRPGFPDAAPNDGSPTAGHYWKREPGGSADPGDIGDKIACTLCHDPHRSRTGGNDVFFPTATTDYNGGTVDLQKLETNHYASPNSRNPTVGNTGRTMCAECHAYAFGSGTPETIAGLLLPRPPDNIPQHRDTSTTPCTDCHKHNRVSASCTECHGFPPLLAVDHDPTSDTNKYGQSYAGGAGAHQRHLDALGADLFRCEICHGPNSGAAAWHNEGSGAVSQGNVDVMGESAWWDPDNSRTGLGYSGTGSGVALPSGYEFVAKGGGNQRCYNIACHGDPPNVPDALNWTDNMALDVGETPGVFELDVCRWCHDGTPAVLDLGAGPVRAPNVMGDGASFGAEVSGHGLAAGSYDGNAVGAGGGVAAANKDCLVCHNPAYATGAAVPNPNAPVLAHYDQAYDSAQKRLVATINAVPIGGPDDTCTACHQSGVTAGVTGTQLSTHGNDPAGGNQPIEPVQFARACRQCHEPHGMNWNGAGRNLHMVGTWLDNTPSGDRDGAGDPGEEARVDSNAADATTDITAADLRVTFTASTGAGSYDAGNNEGFSPPRGVCVVCHVALENNHNQVGDSVPRGSGHNPVGGDCMDCHDHDWDNDVATADGFAPSGCYSCHGTNDTEALQPGAIRRQYWPDGQVALLGLGYDYSDDQPGAHLSHVEAISLQIYQETAAVLVTDTANGTSYDKQRTVCAFCHPNPGGPGHFTNVAGDPLVDRVNVLGGTGAGDWLRKYVPDPGVRAVYADDTTGAPPNGYDFGTESCANLVCHNEAATPAAPTGWNSPPVWAAVIDTRCSQTTCHDPATYTNSHDIHVGAATKAYECSECHADNGVNLGHGNGEVDMDWTNAAAIEQVAGAGDGSYAKGTAFAYKNGTYDVACSLVYCHGGDNAAWGGGDTTPVWDNSAPDSVYCGSCHDGNGTAAPEGDASVTATGNHTDHLTATHGPAFGAGGCTGTATTGCHPPHDESWVPTFSATHVNGTRDFANIDTAVAATSTLGATAPAGPPPAGNTDRCSACHSTVSVTANVAGPATVTGVGTALAKTNWANGAYALPCVSCHNGTDPGANFADGSGRPAPDVLGTDVAGEYGAEVRGHNRSLADGTYPVSGNPPAAQLCGGCHDTAATHLNDADDTTYLGNRMLATIQGRAVASPRQACEACHDNAASPATRRNVKQHSNNGYPAAAPLGRLEADFTVPECLQCHDPHGMTFVGAGLGSNIYMVNATITVVPGTTVSGVRFQALTGDYSFNDTLGTPGDDLCAVCHQDPANPGTPMAFNADGVHATAFYDTDERGRNCSNCHTHNRDNDTAYPGTLDGFMPVACNECHTYPGLANLGAPTHTNTPAHDIHAGQPVAGPVDNYAFRCRTCHYLNSHNETGMEVGQAWVPPGANVDIRFDPARNGGSPTYAGANASTASAPGVGGTGACAALYCHGNGTNGTDGGNLAFPAGFQGTVIAPQWSVAAHGDCGTCHEIASSPAPVGTVAHPTHVNPFASGGYAIGCQVCHYGTTTDGTTVPAASMPIHVNGTVELSFDAAASPRVDAASVYNSAGDVALGAPYYDCSGTYCHSNGTDLAAPYDSASGGAAEPAAALAWDQAAQCGSCHGDGAADATPAYADGAPKANKHPLHAGADDPLASPNSNAYGCQVCHDPTTTTGVAVTTPANHVNRIYTVDDDNANTAPEGTFDSFAYTAGTPGSCSAVTCHGGRTLAWDAGTQTCDLCHASLGGSKAGVTDVNNFAGRDWVHSKVNDQAGGEYGAAGHGAQAVACAGCHDSAVGHDLTMAGADPYRLGAGFTCLETASCHTGATSATVRNHSEADMNAASIPPQRSPWPWTPQCVNCHDPHGDGTNLSMLQRELYDKQVFSLTGAAPPAPIEQPNLVFTDDTTGIDTTVPYTSFADSGAFSSVCQECHEAGAMFSFRDGGPDTTVDPHPGFPNGNPGDCMACHTHESGFAPAGCDGCHGTPPHAGINGGAGDDAPSVMDYWATSGHGAETFNPGTGLRAVDCYDCHNISDPPGTHLDGTLDGHTPSPANANPFHMVTGFIVAPTNDWSVQVAFDDQCWTRCHQGRTTDMRHAIDTSPVANAVEFGQHQSYAQPLNTPPPDMFYDVNLTWLGGFDGGTNYAPCVTCHNPHGTGVASPRGDGDNKMVIYRWARPPVLCNRCHQ